MEKKKPTSPLADYLNRISVQFYPNVQDKIYTATLCTPSAFCKWKKGTMPNKANQRRINQALNKKIFSV